MPVLIELWLLLSLIEFLALLFDYCWTTPLFPPSCFCMDVHWRYSPLPYSCGSHLQQGFLAQEFLCLWLCQSSRGRWNLCCTGIQVLWHHRSVSHCFCVQIIVQKETIIYKSTFQGIFCCLIFRCWLSTKNNFIWSFIGPACLIILVSIILIFYCST